MVTRTPLLYGAGWAMALGGEITPRGMLYKKPGVVKLPLRRVTQLPVGLLFCQVGKMGLPLGPDLPSLGSQGSDWAAASGPPSPAPPLSLPPVLLFQY